MRLQLYLLLYSIRIKQEKWFLATSTLINIVIDLLVRYRRNVLRLLRYTFTSI